MKAAGARWCGSSRLSRIREVLDFMCPPGCPTTSRVYRRESGGGRLTPSAVYRHHIGQRYTVASTTAGEGHSSRWATDPIACPEYSRITHTRLYIMCTQLTCRMCCGSVENMGDNAAVTVCNILVILQTYIYTESMKFHIWIHIESEEASLQGKRWVATHQDLLAIKP